MKHIVKVEYMAYDNGRQIGIAEKELHFDFPELIGTEKQIAYANDLRNKAIKHYCGDSRKISYCARKGESLEENCLMFFKKYKKIDLATISAKEIIEAIA